MGAVRPRSWSGLEALRPVLLGFLSRRSADPHQVEDVIQETFLRAARYRGSLQRTGQLRGWTMRIAANLLRDAQSRRARARCASLDDTLSEPAVEEALEPELDYDLGGAAMDEETARRLLRQAVADASTLDRRMFAAYYGRGEGCAVIGQRLKIPADRVKVRLHRARRRLFRDLRRRAALDAGRRVS